MTKPIAKTKFFPPAKTQRGFFFNEDNITTPCWVPKCLLSFFLSLLYLSHVRPLFLSGSLAVSCLGLIAGQPSAEFYGLGVRGRLLRSRRRRPSAVTRPAAVCDRRLRHFLLHCRRGPVASPLPKLCLQRILSFPHSSLLTSPSFPITMSASLKSRTSP